MRQTGEWQATFDHPLHLYVDGERVGDVSALRVEVVPDALVVHA
jgi:diacylglycerol kinase family enzyme